MTGQKEEKKKKEKEKKEEKKEEKKGDCYGRDDIEGSIRGPRGSKNISISIYHSLFVILPKNILF